MSRLAVVLVLAGSLMLFGSILPAPGESAAATGVNRTRVEHGRALFQAKGCVACHSHAAVTETGFGGGIGPDLTELSFNPDYLSRWLADPKSIRPNTIMPDLDLDGSEIEALIAFINSDHDS